MSELVVSSRDALAKFLDGHDHEYDSDCGEDYGCTCGEITDYADTGLSTGEHLADALLASGVVRPLPDEETLAGLVANERKLFEDAPRGASVFCDAHLYGFENGIRAALALFKGGEK